jgi:uncharacterized membrane protein YphA (DoxX/SURF4 family)
MKLMEPYQNFLAVIYGYKILAGPAAKFTAMVLPWAELIFGIFLLKGLWTRFSAGVLWLLNTVFIAVVSQALIRKLPITDCGCFGDTALSMSLDKLLWLDLGLWVIFAVLFIRAKDASWCGIDWYFEKKSSA